MARKKPGRPTMAEHEAQRVLAGIRRILGQEKGNQAATARRLGIEPPSLHDILKGANRPSLDTARSVARAEGRSLSEYLDEFWGDEMDPKYPMKARAASAAHTVGLPEEAIADMLKLDPGFQEDPGPGYWLKEVERLALLQELQRRPKTALPAAGIIDGEFVEPDES